MKIRNLIPALFGFKLGPEVELPDPWIPQSILIVEVDPLKPDASEIKANKAADVRSEDGT